MDNFPVPTAPVTAPLVDCGLGATVADCGDASGAMCLVERGTFTFAEKAQSCQGAGGVGAVVFNQAGDSGPVYGTLGETRVAIPVVGVDRPTGIALRARHLGTDATLEFARVEFDYDYFSGTSMATPHVAAAAALIWSTHLECSNLEIEQALTATALDLGNPGRDPKFGFGLVQTRSASEWLDAHPCAGG